MKKFIVSLMLVLSGGVYAADKPSSMKVPPLPMSMVSLVPRLPIDETYLLIIQKDNNKRELSLSSHAIAWITNINKNDSQISTSENISIQKFESFSKNDVFDISIKTSKTLNGELLEYYTAKIQVKLYQTTTVMVGNEKYILKVVKS